MGILSAKLLFFVAFLCPVWCLEFTQCLEDLVVPYSYKSEVLYDGLDSIYILGRNSNFKLNLTDNSLEAVGHLPRQYHDGAAAADKDGNVYYLGGVNQFTPDSSDVYKFSRENPLEPTIVGQIVGSCKQSRAYVTIGDVVYRFGGALCGIINEIEEYNLTSHTGRIVGHLPTYGNYASAVYDGQYAYIFADNSGSGSHVLQFNPNTYGVKLLEAWFHSMTAFSTAVIVDKTVYIFEHNTYDHRKNIFLFDTETHKVTVQGTELMQFPSAVFVKSQRRMYIFAFGSSFPNCLDFPPEVFECTGKPDGDYPHPSECTTYMTCSNEISYERNCPPNLHFCSDILRCTYPEEANCTEK